MSSVQSGTLPCCFFSQTANNYPFHGLFSGMCVCGYCIFVLSLVTLLFEMARTCDEALSSALEHKKAVTCLMEKI